MEEKIREEKITFFRLLYSGALGIAVFALVQFLQLPNLDVSLTIGLYCFAISIPFTATGIVLLTQRSIDPPEFVTLVFNVGGIVGLLASVLGMACLFWHFCPAVGIVFTIASISAYLSSVYYFRQPRTQRCGP